jgi:hypothetical protein
MEKNQSSLLYDIRNAIIEIESFLDIEDMSNEQTCQRISRF